MAGKGKRFPVRAALGFDTLVPRYSTGVALDRRGLAQTAWSGFDRGAKDAWPTWLPGALVSMELKRRAPGVGGLRRRGAVSTGGTTGFRRVRRTKFAAQLFRSTYLRSTGVALGRTGFDRLNRRAPDMLNRRGGQRASSRLQSGVGNRKGDQLIRIDAPN